MTDETHALIVNGGQASKSPAALLSEQHARDEDHKVTVEDVPDEEDIKHPPPSAVVKSESVPASDVNAKKATAPEPKPARKAPTFDVQSEELFPALGSGPKSKAPANVSMSWGARTGAASTPANGTSQPSGMFTP
jgi:hypothetical protein